MIVDKRLGLELASGEKGIYCRFLKSFLTNNDDMYKRIIAAFISGDIRLAHRLTHTLKGRAAQIGAVRLEKSTFSIELLLFQHLTDENTVIPEEQWVAFSLELDSVIHELEYYIRNIKNEVGMSPKAENIKEIQSMSTIPEFSILIVDDDSSNLLILRRILEGRYTLYAAKSGTVALTVAKEKKPDIILLDIIMPDMSGFDVLIELRRDDLTRRIPVIYITGMDSVENEEKGFMLGAADYITKPFHSSIVKARVKTQLEIVKQIRRLEQYGLIDALMDIPNRRSFDTQIEIERARATREKTPLGLLLIDIDNFKNYNDDYGHQQGDIALQTLGKLLMSSLKRKTDMAFRWGGEELAVILPDTALDGALKIAEDIRACIESAEIPDDYCNTRSLTVSIGVACISGENTKCVTELVSKADKSLYSAKADGKNCVRYAAAE